VKKILLASLVLAACGGDDDDGAATPDARPSQQYGGDRPVELQTPAIEPGETYPLVLLLHGYGVNGLIQTAYLQMADLPDEGIFLLAPNGTTDAQGNQFWNASPWCCGNGSTVDDVAYLGGLVEDVMADWPIDPARVYAIGHSNGHFMSYRLACERADLFAAIGGLAGGAYSLDGTGCDPSQPVNVLHIHGTADATVPYEGAATGPGFPGAVASVDQWQAKNGCATTRTTGTPMDLDKNQAGDETVVETGDDCPAAGAVELWTINGAGHVPAVADDFGDRLRAWLLAHAR
jgi:polyhydroxybutyrate depolymerase